MATKKKAAPRRVSAKPATVIQRTAKAELVAAVAGFVLTAAILAYSIWQGLALTGETPALTIERLATHPVGAESRVQIKVRNAAGHTAAAVEVEGVLRQGGEVVETAHAHFDYVPGMGSAEGGLMFRHDPARGELELDIKGYALP